MSLFLGNTTEVFKGKEVSCLKLTFKCFRRQIICRYKIMIKQMWQNDSTWGIFPESLKLFQN